MFPIPRRREGNSGTKGMSQLVAENALVAYNVGCFGVLTRGPIRGDRQGLKGKRHNDMFGRHASLAALYHQNSQRARNVLLRY